MKFWYKKLIKFIEFIMQTMRFGLGNEFKIGFIMKFIGFGSGDEFKLLDFILILWDLGWEMNLDCWIFYEIYGI